MTSQAVFFHPDGAGVVIVGKAVFCYCNHPAFEGRVGFEPRQGVKLKRVCHVGGVARPFRHIAEPEPAVVPVMEFCRDPCERMRRQKADGGIGYGQAAINELLLINTASGHDNGAEVLCISL